jgi:quercetin dioxygenase-like cupin family protein
MLTTRPMPIDARLRCTHSQGALAVIETVIEPDAGGPALHVLPSLDESFYILQGKLTFQVGDALFIALQGASVFAQRGTPHTYANQSGEAARVLIVCTPGVELSDGAASTDARTTRGDTIHRSDIVGPPLER